MEFVVVLITLICYGLACVLWWYRQTPLFLLTLVSGHGAALASPLWEIVYGVTYIPEMPVMHELFGFQFLTPLVIASSWFYTLPALIILYLYRYQLQLRFSGYLTGLIIYGAFLFYHLIIETLGLRLQLWIYTIPTPLPLGISSALISVIMAALISLSLLYLLLVIYRYGWVSMFLTLVPTTLILSLLVHGILGAPLWIALFGISRLLPDQSWAISVGLVSTLALLAWGVHIVCWGLEHVDQELK